MYERWQSGQLAPPSSKRRPISDTYLLSPDSAAVVAEAAPQSAVAVLVSPGLSGKPTSLGSGCSSTACISLSASVGASCFAAATAASICASCAGSSAPSTAAPAGIPSPSSAFVTSGSPPSSSLLEPFSGSRLAVLFSSDSEASRVSRPRLWQYQKTKRRTGVEPMC